MVLQGGRVSQQVILVISAHPRQGGRAVVGQQDGPRVGGQVVAPPEVPRPGGQGAEGRAQFGGPSAGYGLGFVCRWGVLERRVWAEWPMASSPVVASGFSLACIHPRLGGLLGAVLGDGSRVGDLEAV